MRLRTDSRGDLIKRALIGDKTYFKNIVENMQQQKKGVITTKKTR